MIIDNSSRRKGRAAGVFLNVDGIGEHARATVEGVDAESSPRYDSLYQGFGFS